MTAYTKHVDKEQVVRHIATHLMKAQKTVNYAGNDQDGVSNARTASDTDRVLVIPAKAFVTKVGMILLTAQGATCTATLGDAAGATTWDATACNLNAAANSMYVSTEGTDTNGLGKYYAAADYVLIDYAHTVDAAKITYFMEYFIID